MTGLRADLARFDAIETSWLRSHPGGGCCTITRQLIFGSILRHADLPSQLAEVPAAVVWGPVRWPAHWCELEQGNGFRGDCGAQAHLAHELLTDHGIEHARGRAAIRVTPLARRNWEQLWRDERGNVPTPWIGAELIHHEVLRIGSRWWDPTQAVWFEGFGARLTNGEVVALKVDGEAWQIPQR